MSEILAIGQIVQTGFSNRPCKVEAFLGGGGQGEVYLSELGGRKVALKWYFSHAATQRQKTALEVVIKKGPPNQNFLWPIELVSSASAGGFGYVMPLREMRYKGIVDLMRRRIDPTFRALATTGFELAHSFLQLHSKGLCYCDISFGNVFFDPDTGEVLICDNDNVTVDGGSTGGILGTPRFMAPEVVRGAARPSTQTDLYSLAVLMFYIFMVHHPLEGRKELAIHSFDLPAMTKLYGIEPVFIFDPSDDSNEPVAGYHDNALLSWPLYPQFLRDLFIEAFTEGIRDPENGRIREGEWRSGMIRLRDSIVYCQRCSIENFRDLDTYAGRVQNCWSCSTPLQSPYYIRIGRQVVMLNYDSRLFPHHIDAQKGYDFSQPVAEVTRHPQNPDIWGLKNLSGQVWSFTTTGDPRPAEVAPERSVSLATGTRINFGNTEGEIKL